MEEIKIGDQIWSQKNLEVLTYRNGDPIPIVTDPKEWADLETGAACFYDNDAKNASKYGLLYNWYAVNDPRNLAPDGWHVATDEEWEELGGKTAKLKLLLGGFRHAYYGTFDYMNLKGRWWSSTGGSSAHAWYRKLSYGSSGVGRYNYHKQFGFSVRLVKDMEGQMKDSDKKLSCFVCGKSNKLTMVAHTNKDDKPVGFIFVCGKCEEFINKKRIRYHLEDKGAGSTA